MPNVKSYILFLVIGVTIGFVGIYLITQTPSVSEQVTVTIQKIEYTSSDNPLLKIELENNVPNKNLEGNITIYQDERLWTSKVTWFYTGLGVAEFFCNSINETQNFRITYVENNPKEIYLDRNIEWNEVSQNTVFTFMETEELKITSLDFAADDITANVRNTGTTDVVIIGAKSNGVAAATAIDVTITAGGTGTVVVDAVTFYEGTAYNVELLSSKGNKFTYTGTATVDST